MIYIYFVRRSLSLLIVYLYHSVLELGASPTEVDNLGFGEIYFDFPSGRPMDESVDCELNSFESKIWGVRNGNIYNLLVSSQ